MGRLKLCGGLVGALLAFSVLWFPQVVYAAAYATGGSGKYKNDILWLTWGGDVNGTHDRPLTDGSQSIAHLQVAKDVYMQVTCTLREPTNPLTSYRPGTWSGDRLDYLYNIGGNKSDNQLVTGIVNRNNQNGGNTAAFKVACNAQIGGKDIDLRGFVIADAESMATGEYIESTAQGDWYVIETLKNGNGAHTYNVAKTVANGQNKITVSSGGGDGARNVVTFLKFSTPEPSKTMEFAIRGGGKTAIAIGLVVPFADFGDAPASYGDAMHLIDDINFSSDNIAQGATVNVNAASYAAAQFLSPSRNYLGTRGPDSEPGSVYSQNADGDDKTGPFADEENAWLPGYKTLSILQAGTALSVPVACNGSGRVYSWIDFDINGTFDAYEKAEAPCQVGSALLNWTIPAGIKAGDTYVRLRYSLGSTNVTPTSVADDGEVEDHRITVQSPLLSITKSSNANNGVWAIGQADARYTLTVSNRGAVATGPAAGVVQQPVTVLDTLPAGISPKWSGVLNTNGWSCTVNGALVTCLSSNFLAPNGGSSSIELPVNVLPAAADTATLTNYASVGGGHDPSNGGLPPVPGSCSQPYYCAQAAVNVKRPAVWVAKVASPATQSKVEVGDVITYTLRVNVSDEATLSPVVLLDTLGAGLRFGAITENAAGFVMSSSGLSRSFTLPAGKAPSVYSISYNATVDTTAVTAVNNKVIPSGGGNPDDPKQPAPSCTAGCETSHPVLGPLVVVNKTADPVSGATVKAEQTITYTLTTVVTRSPTLSPVVLHDRLGTGLNFGVVVANDGYAISGSGNSRDFTLPAGTPPGTYSIRYTAMVQADAASGVDIHNQVVPSGGGTPTDPPPSCGSCATNHVLAPPKVEYAKTTTAVKAQVGQDIDFQVMVKVSDARTTAPVEITDTLGAGLAYQADSATGDLALTSAGNPLIFTLPVNTPPGTYRVRYLATVTAAAGPSVTNSVTGSGGGDPAPNCLAGNACQTTTPVEPSVVRYDKSTTATGVNVGEEVTFSLNVWVSGGPTAHPLTLTDTLGAGLEYGGVADNPLNWGITSNGQVVTVTIPANLPVSATPHKLSYKAKVTSAASGSVRNAVVGTGMDNPGCASSCATETPVVKPLVIYSKTSPTASARVGDLITYRVKLVVQNSQLTEAVSGVVDNLGLGLEFVGMTSAPSFTHTENGQALTLTLPAGTPPGTYVAEYQARVTPQAVSTVQNRVEGIPAPGGLTPVCAPPCQVVTPVIREIDAVDKALADVQSFSGSPFAGNAYDNDTLNGKPVTLASIVGTVVTPATPLQGGSVPVLDVATGAVSVAPGTPAGDYVIEYRICDRQAPSICDTAKITIRVLAPFIKAVDDSYVANRGQGSAQVVGNAYGENDLLAGIPFANYLITGEVLAPAAPIGGNPLVPTLDPLSGKVTVQPHTPAGDYYIPYRICEKINPTNCDTAVVKVVLAPDASLLRIVKTAAVRTVKIGDLVRYSLQVQNVGAVNVVNANVVDTAANGFSFVNGSMSAVGLGSAVAASGVRPVQFSGVTLEAGKTGTITYMMRVGAGVRPGNHVNTAFAKNGVGDSISNQATASVELVSDPLLDDSLIFGTVFDDRDRDGWQDSAKISGLKAQGGFAPGAYIANSTTVDKGQGAEPAPDASAPLLHGLDLGSVTARQSEADPVAKHTVVIHQQLQSLDFTDDFVLSNDQGVTVRMDAAGNTTVEKSGEAAAGRNAVAIEVERKISQQAGGYGVDYIIRSTGIDERGIPGVRVASVEGLLMETDPFGRYHLVGVNGGRWERGRHFILKVDPSTLPAGAEFTTSNPLLRRITPGLPVRFDFGVQLNPEFMAGEHQAAEIELGSVLFAAGSTEIRSQYLTDAGVIAQVAAKVQQYRGGELLISANGESEAVAFARAEAVRKAVTEKLPADVQAATRVTVRADVNDAGSLVSGVTANGAVLGSVLFDTDKAVVRPQHQALLQKVAAYLNAQGPMQQGGVVSIIGHTDVRASHTYNQKLGLARAKAVYEALLPYLSDDIKRHIQVQAETGAKAQRSVDLPVNKATPH